MITNSSKLMLANKEIEFLREQLRVTNSDILDLEEDINLVEQELQAEKSMVAELKTRILLAQENYATLYKELEYNKEHPWWKFW
jgi:peptidoglycan hydrolase CwlO-like protein